MGIANRIRRLEQIRHQQAEATAALELTPEEEEGFKELVCSIVADREEDPHEYEVIRDVLGEEQLQAICPH